MKVIPEGDIYRLVIKSQLPTAENDRMKPIDDIGHSDKVVLIGVEIMEDGKK